MNSGNGRNTSGGRPGSGAPESQTAALVLNSASRIEGRLQLSGDSSIEGSVLGDIESTGAVTLASTSSLEGTIVAAEITIFGLVKGKVQTSGLLRLCAGARVEGELTAGRLAIEDGVRFEGVCKMAQGKAENVAEVDLHDRLL